MPYNLAAVRAAAPAESAVSGVNCEAPYLSSIDYSTRRAILLLASAGFCSAASVRVCDPLIPEMAEAFGASTAQAAQTVTAFALFYGILQIAYGLLGDRFGKYALITLAALACAVVNLLSAFAPGMTWLIGLRALGGAAAAGIIPLSMAWLGDTVPYESRQTALAHMLMGSIGGMMGGQLLGGVFADTLGWRWAFVLLAVLFLIVAMGLFVELRGNERKRLTAARTDTGIWRPSAVDSIRQVLQVRWARVILLVVFTEGLLIFGATTFFATYLHQAFGLALSAAGAIVALFGAGGILYALLVSGLIKRLHEHGLAALGASCMSIGLIAFALSPDWIWAALAVPLTGFGFYMMHNTLQTNATQMAPAVRGTALALFASALFLGNSVGVAVAGTVYEPMGALGLFLVASLGLGSLGALFWRALRRR